MVRAMRRRCARRRHLRHLLRGLRTGQKICGQGIIEGDGGREVFISFWVRYLSHSLRTGTEIGLDMDWYCTRPLQSPMPGSCPKSAAFMAGIAKQLELEWSLCRIYCKAVV